jgi:hypothetical protein
LVLAWTSHGDGGISSDASTVPTVGLTAERSAPIDRPSAVKAVLVGLVADQLELLEQLTHPDVRSDAGQLTSDSDA